MTLRENDHKQQTARHIAGAGEGIDAQVAAGAWGAGFPVFLCKAGDERVVNNRPENAIVFCTASNVGRRAAYCVRQTDTIWTVLTKRLDKTVHLGAWMFSNARQP